MNITRSHNTTKEVAIQKIDKFLNELMGRDFSQGVKIKNPEKQWSGDKMSFSFTAKKGFLLSIKLTGDILVTEKDIQFESKLPGAVSTFIGEDKVREVMNNQFDELFSEV